MKDLQNDLYYTSKQSILSHNKLNLKPQQADTGTLKRLYKTPNKAYHTR